MKDKQLLDALSNLVESDEAKLLLSRKPRVEQIKHSLEQKADDTRKMSYEMAPRAKSNTLKYVGLSIAVLFLGYFGFEYFTNTISVESGNPDTLGNPDILNAEARHGEDNGNNFLLIGFIIALAIGCFIFVKIFIRQNLNQLSMVMESKKISLSATALQDDVYNIISISYDTLLELRGERKRQAKNSFNAALSLMVTGAVIVFFGVYLFWTNVILSASLTTGAGTISEAIGLHSLKLYRDTNNRMDKIDGDLFTLETTKVQYALILKISETTDRDKQIQKLIAKISNIKKK